MSRVLNVSLAELDAAKLPPICAATGRQGTNAQFPATDVTLVKLDLIWFAAAVVFGPLCFVVTERGIQRKRLRLPIDPAIRAEQDQRQRRALNGVRMGNLAFLAIPGLYMSFLTFIHQPASLAALIHAVLPGLLLFVGVCGWLIGLVGIWRLCHEANHIPALLETFDSGRVAIELPNWWVADEYRRALGHPLQGEPKAENDQAAEDAMWEAKGKPSDWDKAPPPPTPPLAQ
ncbi:MAG TPA: hypothetical protein VL860_00855 [Planctomycetota bacterium]|nr:hypothetical protein [Planctomycetota bacterium]